MIDKKRKDYILRRKFDEKRGNVPGCPKLNVVALQICLTTDLVVFQVCTSRVGRQ